MAVRVPSTAVAMAVMGVTMLPSALPLLRLDFVTARSRLHTAAVAGGYLTVWGLLGAATMPLAMIGMPRVAAAAALVVAAGYQVSPLARACLTRCRAPLARIVIGWRDGVAGGLWMGLRDGLWCAGCCAGLLVALVVLGASSMWGMVLFGAAAAAQKVTPFGVGASRALAVALGAGAVLVL